MNRNCYRLVRNRLTQLWTPAPEHARGRGKGTARAALLLTSSLLSLAAHGAGALPVPCGAGACGTNPSVPGFASHGAAAYATAGNRAFVSQVGNKAILNWQNFNVGRGNSVTFKQVDGLVSGNAVAGANFSTLNRIWQADPSVIAGAINVAAGQKGNLTFINQNGIVFAGTAQVDVNTLTATSLNMADKFFTGALTPFGNREAQFEGFKDSAGNDIAPGFVTVLEGARISAASGGRVMLLAPTVTNRGQIETPNGQTILGAGNKIYLTASNDINLRGLLIEVDSTAGLANFNTANTGIPSTVTLDGETLAVADTYSNLGHVTNNGNVQVGTGNTTMIGYAVNQMGRVSATTSIILNGSIYLTAKDTKAELFGGSGTEFQGFVGTRAGRVRIGENSRTAVVPELDADKVRAALGNGRLNQTMLDNYYAGDARTSDFSPYMVATTSVDAQDFNRSQVRVVGQDIRVETGALVRVPAGDVAFYAVDNPADLKIYNPNSLLDPFESYLNSVTDSAARLQFASGVTIDVSGLEGVQIPVSRNIVEVKLQGEELKDSPVNRDGKLRGEKVWIDVTRSSALVANVEDYKAGIGRDVAERSTLAGTVSLRSQGEVVVPEGVTLNVSGGHVDYTAAAVKTTLLAVNGKLVDIANADPEVRYDNVASRLELTDPRWGVTRVFDIAENGYNPGYREGKDAGSVELLARRAVFAGDVVGRTSAGYFQNQASAPPAGAALTIGKPLGSTGILRDNFLNQSVVIGAGLNVPAIGFGEPLPTEWQDTLWLSSRLIGGTGVNRLEVYSNNAIKVDQALLTAPKGSVKLVGERVDIHADIQAPSGNVSATAQDNRFSATVGFDVVVGDDVRIDVSGHWINDGLTGAPASEVRAIHAGSINFNALDNLLLGGGSIFDVTGGGYRGVNGKVTGGNAGALELSFLQLQPTAGIDAVSLDQHIASASLGNGGSFALSARQVEIGAFDPAATSAVRLDPGFFRQGFSSYAVTGLQGVEVLPDTQVMARTASRDLLSTANAAATGVDLAGISIVREREDVVRKPANLTLSASAITDRTGTTPPTNSTLQLGEGALLAVDPGAKVTLNATARMELLGNVSAPGGSITATLSKNMNNSDYDAADAIVLGPKSQLSVAGFAKVYPNSKGLRQGDVLPGGSVTLNAVTGYVVADGAAVIDVSGAGAVTLDQPNAQGGFGMTVAGDAGVLNVSAREGMHFNPVLYASGGGPQARSGTFVLGFGSKVVPNPPGSYPTSERIVKLGGVNPVLPADFHELSGSAYVDPMRLEQAGFDRISIKSLDRILFQDDVNLGTGANRPLPLGALRLDAPNIEVNNRNVNVAASIIELGNYDIDRQDKAASTAVGTGTFTAKGGFVELAGRSAWTGATTLNFLSDSELRLSGVSTGDAVARPVGVLDTPADINIFAGVVAPATLTDFTVQTVGDAVVGARGSTVIPLSAQGAVTISAANIRQGGRIHAPQGRVSLEATHDVTLVDGSVTSTGGIEGTTPFGTTINGRTWTYNFGNSTQTISALDNKSVSLKGQNVQMLEGSVVDVSGRGDLQAWEFTPGSGGSKDILADSGVYAVLPGYRGVPAPGDPQNLSGFDRAKGTSVWLDGAPGLPSGSYTLLPAHYALLPGAYMVKVAGARKDVLPGQGGDLGNGTHLVSGYLTDTRHDQGGPRDGLYSGYTLISQTEVLRRSEFSLSSASTFFADTAAGRPGDAGRLSVDAAQSLVLNSGFETASLAGMRGAEVDITAPKIAVVSTGGATAGGTGYVTIDVQSLSNLKASSLLLGGTRTTTAEGVAVHVGAQEVVIANTDAAPLTGAELIVAANDKVTVKAGSVIEGKGGTSTGTPAKLIVGDTGEGVSGNGALLRVAAGAQSEFERRNVDRSLGVNTGEIRVEGAQLPADGGRAAAVLRADGALRIDATKETLVSGDLQLATGGALALGAARVSVGETAGVNEGLVLSNERIAALGRPAELAIRSYTTLDLYGNAVLGDISAGADRVRSLLIETGGIGGYANAGKTAVIAADSVTLANPSATAYAGAPVPGDGTLRIAAQTVRLGSGGTETVPFEVRGFATTRVEAAKEVVAQGSGELRSAKSLEMETTRISAAAGSNFKVSVDAGALITATPTVKADGFEAAALGGKLVLSAPTITHGTRIDMPSGVVQLNATGVAGPGGAGSVTLAPDSSISAAGRQVDFFDVSRPTNGGSVALSSVNADIRINATAVVDVSGADGADAGTLAIHATKGTAQFDGTLLGAARAAGGNTPRQGGFILDVATLGNFNQLNQILESTIVDDRIVSGGFTESRDIRIRSGNVEIGSAGDPAATVTARNFQLAADAGRIDVYGQIDAQGDTGGTVKLYAGTGLTVHADAGIAASAAAAGSRGGDVLLSTSTGNVSVVSGSSIDVSAGVDGRAGELHVRAPRSAGNNEINITSLSGAVTGAGVIRAEGFKTYVDTSIATADFGTGASPATSWFNEAKNFMDDTAAIETRLGMVSDNRFQLAPGIEIRSTNTATSVVDQALANDWTLHTWRYDPDTGAVASAGQLASGLNAAGKPLVAGVLTVRSTGALNLNGSLSDGFNSALTTGSVQGRESWSYRLVAGADLTAANPLAVKVGTRDVTLDNAKLVRTGTGDIAIASGDAINMGNFQSVVYTAGRPVAASALAGFTVPAGAVFTQDGGEISLQAMGDIALITNPTASQRQLYSNWLYRQGKVNASGDFSAGSNPQTAWWVQFSEFQQGVAALGGGNVNVTAGNAIRNVSVSSATQGYMAASRPDPASLKVLGGGDVEVTASGDIEGGQYWSGRGELALRSGGSITSANIGTVGSPKALYTILALSDTRAEVSARGDLNVHAILDPMLLVPDSVGTVRNVTSNLDPKYSLFSSQGENTRVQLDSLTGAVRLHMATGSTNVVYPEAVGIRAEFGSLTWNNGVYDVPNDRPLSLVPGSLRATAFQGDIDIRNDTILMPAANGALELLAGNNVILTGALIMSDMDVARVPAAYGSPGRDASVLPSFLGSNGQGNWRAHAESAPVHINDAEPARIYAAGGDISGEVNSPSLIVPKAVRVMAGRDITNLTVEGQNLRDSDVSLLQAGRDIQFSTQTFRSQNAKVLIGGPGLVDIVAGHNLDLGSSEGIVTRGGLDNPALTSTGAAINIAVGAPKGVDYQGAMNRLIAALQGAAAAGAVLDTATLWQVRWLTGDNSVSSPAAALAAVQAIDALPDAAQRLRVRSMFFQALRDAGRDYNKPASPYAGDYSRGYKTIELLFPGSDEKDAQGRSLRYNGELNLFASRVKTERGGDIEFMVPGGQAVIGLAQISDALTKDSSGAIAQLGMVTVEQGAVRGFAREDILVNRSRILTVGGGDVLLWSSEADIDAGKGKRTVTTIPPPIIKTDSNGNVTVELQGVATGSGIGALAGQPGVVAGDVDLIAPKGAVNAGEAGIRASNLNIAALVVLNAENIQVSGATAGAPVADTSGLASGLAGNSVSDTQGQDAARALSNQSAEAQKTADDVRRALAAFNLISVEVLGLGEQ